MLFARVATLSDPGLTTSELVFSPSDAGRHAVGTESVPVGERLVIDGRMLDDDLFVPHRHGRSAVPAEGATSARPAART